MTDLTMRRDDYIVIWDEVAIGRMFRSNGVGRHRRLVLVGLVAERAPAQRAPRRRPQPHGSQRAIPDRMGRPAGADQLRPAQAGAGDPGPPAPVAPLRTPGWLELHESGTYVRLLTRARICWKRPRLQPEARLTLTHYVH